MLSEKKPEWFVVKPGDTLENGLVVKSAKCAFEKCFFLGETEPCILQTQSWVTFENQMTMKGVLYCTSDNEEYFGGGALLFYPDPALNSAIPVICYGNKPEAFDISKATFSNASFLSDNTRFQLGTLDSAAVDLSKVIDKGGICEVSVTLGNIRIQNENSSSCGAFADIVSIEKIA